jgi:hypothetical protein
MVVGGEEEDTRRGMMTIERGNMKTYDGLRRSHGLDRIWTSTDPHVVLLFFSWILPLVRAFC